MDRSSSQWQQLKNRDRSKAVVITKEQIEKQLAAVTELRNYNATYLEHFENAWINYVIDTAVAVVADLSSQDEALLQPERTSRNTDWLRDKLSTKHIRSLSKDLKPPKEQLKLLLTTANSLNSALNLLSCCYDRWLWLESSKNSDVHLSETANDLRDFLDWKRQRVGGRGQAHAPELRDKQRSSAVNSIGREGPISPRASTDVSDDSETQLSFLIVDTVEKWRQNAEDALTATTKRYHGRTLGSLLRHEKEMNSSIPASDTIPMQITRQLPHGMVSVSQLVSDGQDRTNRNQVYDDNGAIMDAPINHSAQPNLTVPRRPVPQRVGFPASQWPHYGEVPTSPSISQPQQHSIPYPTHPLFYKSLQNSFDKEPTSTETIQIPYSSPPLRSEVDYDLLKPVSNGQSTSDISSPRLNDLYTHSSTPVGQSQSDISSESSTAASAVMSQTLNESVVSFKSKSIDGGIVPRSRGRMLLEQQEEWERSQQQHLMRHPMR